MIFRLTSCVVPLSAVVFIVFGLFLTLPSPDTPLWAGIIALDWAGSLLIVGGTLMILLSLQFGGIIFPWSSSTVICLILFGVLVVCLFVVNEWKFARNPLVPLRLFSSISSAAAYTVFALNSYVFIGLAYYLPLYSQSVLDANALVSGIYLLPLIISSSLAAAFSGVFIQQTGKYRSIMFIAQILLTLGVGLFVDLKFEKSLTRLFVFEIIVGIGVGMNIEAPIIAAQAATTVRDTAAVSATMGFFRSIATAISVIVGGVIFQNKVDALNSSLVGQLGPQRASQFNGSQVTVSVELIDTLPQSQQILVRQVYFEALRTVWIMVRESHCVPAIVDLRYYKRSRKFTHSSGPALGNRLTSYKA